MELTVKLPGVVDQMVRESSWPSEDAARWQRYQAGSTSRRVGKGWQVTITLSAKDMLDLGDTLDAQLGAVASMSASERGGGSEVSSLRTALDRIWPELVKVYGPCTSPGCPQPGTEEWQGARYCLVHEHYVSRCRVKHPEYNRFCTLREGHDGTHGDAWGSGWE